MKIPFVFKKCSKCGRWLVANTVNFHKQNTSKDGLHSQCKECRNAHHRKVRADHKEKCPPGYKKCSKCGRVLPANTDNFYRNKNIKGGLGSQCKECQNVSNRKVYEKKHPKEEYPNGYKKCTKCGRVLEANTDNFYRDRGVKCGFHSRCKDCDKEHDKKYNKENKEKIAKQNKKYHIEHRKERAEYRKNHLNTAQGQAAALNGQSKRRQREGQQGRGITGDQWLEMMKFFDWKCAYSGITLNTNNRSIDHIIPLAKGGAHEIWNLVPMYKNYNFSKNNKTMEEWYSEQDFCSESRVDKIYEWIKYAYNKWGNDEIQKTI